MIVQSINFITSLAIRRMQTPREYCNTHYYVKGKLIPTFD